MIYEKSDELRSIYRRIEKLEEKVEKLQNKKCGCKAMKHIKESKKQEIK